MELWSNILLKTQTSNNCRKLFEALPCHIQEELRKIYEKHQEVISDTIICGIVLHIHRKNIFILASFS